MLLRPKVLAPAQAPTLAERPVTGQAVAGSARALAPLAPERRWALARPAAQARAERQALAGERQAAVREQHPYAPAGTRARFAPPKVGRPAGSKRAAPPDSAAWQASAQPTLAPTNAVRGKPAALSMTLPAIASSRFKPAEPTVELGYSSAGSTIRPPACSSIRSLA